MLTRSCPPQSFQPRFDDTYGARVETIAPVWARIGGPFTRVAQAPVERALAGYASRVNARGRESATPTGVVKVVAESARLAEGALGGARAIVASRVVRPVRPDRLARVLLAQRRYGFTPALVAALGAELHHDRTAVIDERGELTFRELDARARSLAGALHSHFDLGAQQRVAIMCRNHRGFVEAAVAASRLGCDLVPLNTEFAGPQLADVLARERVAAVVHDQELKPVFEAAGFSGPRITAWHDGEVHGPTLEALIAIGERDAPAPRATGRIVMLTSGTTGTPKGANRALGRGALAPLALAGLLDLARVKPTPRSGAPLVVAPPLFHLYGLIGLMVAFGLGSPIVIRRRFDTEATLAAIAAHRAEVLLAVPTMLGRIMDLPAPVRSRHDCSSLRMIVSGAAPLPPELGTAVLDQFGEILYNGYASTEVGVGTLATPRDLRCAPGTVGRPAAGVTIRILDDEGLELPAGRTGRIFVGSPMLFDGYSGGGGKEVIDGLMSTGDMGHFDRGGRLFIDGRDDDMILSGGENVFPQEVEETLIAHPDVEDAAVFGVKDRDFGQRLAAVVVRKPEATVSPEELKLHVKTQLARHKVPREITFVERLPRTSTGKLQRRRLVELLPDEAAS
jgi:acyl-CoA synthetase (AMP-forming)/AMP-acid ligase II